MKLRIKELRERAVLSQGELAKRANISHATLNRIEKCRHRPLPKTLRKIAKALGVAPGELLVLDE